jgi:tetratricopeptide (TPR) repeat protein
MIKIKNITEYLGEVKKITEENAPSRYIFRGQTDLTQDVESSAARRINTSLSGTSFSTESFIKYHENMIEIAKMKGYHRKGNIELKDLELIAELQHFSAATFLIDFSRNPLVALWFAVKNNDEKDGVVYLLDINAPLGISQVTIDDIEKKSVQNFLSKPTNIEDTSLPTILPVSNLWYWEPSNFNLRIPKQHSIFVFGPPSIPKDFFRIIQVDKEYKISILKDLEKIYDINEVSLFSDLPGFARANSVNSPFREEVNNYYIYGIYFMQRQEYKKAINYFTGYIKLNENDFFAYSARGISYFQLYSVENDESLLDLALKDYDKAIEINSTDCYPYIGKGMVFILLGKLEDAIANFDKGLELCPENATAYLQRGLVYREMGKYDEALRDLDMTIKYAPGKMEHYHTRGIIYYQKNEDALALADLNKAIEIDPTNPQLYKMRALIKRRMGLREEAKLDEKMAKKLSKT